MVNECMMKCVYAERFRACAAWGMSWRNVSIVAWRWEGLGAQSNGTEDTTGLYSTLDWRRLTIKDGYMRCAF